jgi:hypothetical protein
VPVRCMVVHTRCLTPSFEALAADLLVRVDDDWHVVRHKGIGPHASCRSVVLAVCVARHG